ncbi:MAG: Unknown protein [uncultured Sulfurovum sp.]|uniref:Uncharacterized protein n=1 Tax=uncultured Sulfurovum sp. TaxID=269237 RepID=A0A6S6TLE8_9BACT|nr:MAG: Unknown protein [uncultured Sulfurovum sp.]
MLNNLLKDMMNSISSQGVSFLLPQNLPRDILHVMLDEAEAIDDDCTEVTPSSMLFIAILHLAIGTPLTNNTEVKIKQDDLMIYFGMYITTLRMEEMKRCGRIMIPNNSLPTTSNIFDMKRKIEFTDLSGEI